jgi:hypothetical protein
MGHMDGKKTKFVEVNNIIDDGNIEEELTEVGSSYFNEICINITNMTNSSIHFGNNRTSSSTNPSTSTPSPSQARTEASIRKKKKKHPAKKGNQKPKKTNIKVNLPRHS